MFVKICNRSVSFSKCSLIQSSFKRKGKIFMMLNSNNILFSDIKMLLLCRSNTKGRAWK